MSRSDRKVAVAAEDLYRANARFGTVSGFRTTSRLSPSGSCAAASGITSRAVGKWLGSHHAGSGSHAPNKKKPPPSQVAASILNLYFVIW